MGYRVNLPGMFAVPNSVADEHLKLARELDLKVLLWLLRRGGEIEGMQALAAWLGKPEGVFLNLAASFPYESVQLIVGQAGIEPGSDDRDLHLVIEGIVEGRAPYGGGIDVRLLGNHTRRKLYIIQTDVR